MRRSRRIGKSRRRRAKWGDVKEGEENRKDETKGKRAWKIKGMEDKEMRKSKKKENKGKGRMKMEEKEDGGKGVDKEIR